jgi:hypothetical protein
MWINLEGSKSGVVIHQISSVDRQMLIEWRNVEKFHHLQR